MNIRNVREATKKTILIVHPHFTIPGGAGKVILEIGSRLQKKFKVVIIAQQVEKQYLENYPNISFEYLNGPTTDSFFFWLSFFYWQYRTFRIIDKYNKDKIILIANVFPANWLTLPYKLFHPKTKTFWFCHEPSAFIHSNKWKRSIQNPVKKTLAFFLAPLFSLIDKEITSLADKIFTNSRYTSSLINKIYKRNSIIINPGIDTKKFLPVKYTQKSNTILTVSRLTKFKNIDVLIRAFSKLNSISYKLLIVGDGEEKQNLLELINNLGLSSKVKVLTDISDRELINYYQTARIFVSCSKDEPFGIAPIEAMACGTPVIADRSGGLNETVKNHFTGELINIDENSLINTIEDLISNQLKLQKMSQNCSVWVHNTFNWDQATDSLINNFS